MIFTGTMCSLGHLIHVNKVIKVSSWTSATITLINYYFNENIFVRSNITSVYIFVKQWTIIPFTRLVGIEKNHTYHFVFTDIITFVLHQEVQVVICLSVWSVLYLHLVQCFICLKNVKNQPCSSWTYNETI